MKHFDINKVNADSKYTFTISNRYYGQAYREIERRLILLKFNVSSIGFKYWAYSIILYRQNKFKYDNTIETVYNTVAERFGTTRTRVERAMRTARKTAEKQIELYFSYYLKQTNKSVLELLVSQLYLFDKVEKLETNATYNDIIKHIPRID